MGDLRAACEHPTTLPVHYFSWCQKCGGLWYEGGWHLPKSRPTQEREPDGLDLSDLRSANVARCETFHPLNDWSEPDYATALAGEVGEACNLIKKRRRGDAIPIQEVADELADSLIYLDLLAARCGIDLGEATIRKFNEFSVKKGKPQRLASPPPAQTVDPVAWLRQMAADSLLEVETAVLSEAADALDAALKGGGRG